MRIVGNRVETGYESRRWRACSFPPPTFAQDSDCSSCFPSRTAIGSRSLHSTLSCICTSHAELPFDHPLGLPRRSRLVARRYDVFTFRSAARQALLTQPALHSCTFTPFRSRPEQPGLSAAIGLLPPLRFARPPPFAVLSSLALSLCAKADSLLMQATARAARYLLHTLLKTRDVRLTLLAALELLLHTPFHLSVPSHHPLAQTRRGGLPDDQDPAEMADAFT
jgi:hypothetical protein